MSQNLILTIDLGTSGPKVSVYNELGKLIDHAFRETNQILYEHGGAEQDTNEWKNAIIQAYEEIKGRGRFNSKQIKAINIASLWSATVAIDEKGNALKNAIMWMDSRGAKYIHQKVGDGLIKIDGYNVFKILKFISITGGGPSKSGKDSIAHILYLQNEEKEIYDKAYKFLEPKDYLNAWLCGRICASYDGITLHWVTDNRDINNIKYDNSLIKIFGIDAEKLPELLPSNSIVGSVTKETVAIFDLDENCVVISGSGDTNSAAVGSGAIKDYEPHLYIGTSSWLFTHLPFKKTDIFHNMGTIPSSIPGKYVLANEQECSGVNLNFLKNNIFYPKDELNSEAAPKDFYKRLDEMAAGIPAGSDNLIFLPWLYGERSPVDDHHARGGFYNLSLQHTRAHMARAVFEGVAFNSRWLLKYVEKNMKRQSEGIRFIGGGANSAVWCQIIADVLNRPILQVKDPIQANSRGSAFLASAAMGWIKYEDISELSEIEKIYEPNKNHTARYNDLFEIFIEIYHKNKSIFAKLNN
jgi:xylulokinase